MQERDAAGGRLRSGMGCGDSNRAPVCVPHLCRPQSPAVLPPSPTRCLRPPTPPLQASLGGSAGRARPDTCRGVGVRGAGARLWGGTASPRPKNTPPADSPPHSPPTPQPAETPLTACQPAAAHGTHTQRPRQQAAGPAPLLSVLCRLPPQRRAPPASTAGQRGCAEPCSAPAPGSAGRQAQQLPQASLPLRCGQEGRTGTRGGLGWREGSGWRQDGAPGARRPRTEAPHGPVSRANPLGCSAAQVQTASVQRRPPELRGEELHQQAHQRRQQRVVSRAAAAAALRLRSPALQHELAGSLRAGGACRRFH
jgi:hypothetical protein